MTIFNKPSYNLNINNDLKNVQDSDLVIIYNVYSIYEIFNDFLPSETTIDIENCDENNPSKCSCISNIENSVYIDSYVNYKNLLQSKTEDFEKYVSPLFLEQIDFEIYNDLPDEEFDFIISSLVDDRLSSVKTFKPKDYKKYLPRALPVNTTILQNELKRNKSLEEAQESLKNNFKNLLCLYDKNLKLYDYCKRAEPTEIKAFFSECFDVISSVNWSSFDFNIPEESCEDCGASIENKKSLRIYPNKPVISSETFEVLQTNEGSEVKLYSSLQSDKVSFFVIFDNIFEEGLTSFSKEIIENIILPNPDITTKEFINFETTVNFAGFITVGIVFNYDISEEEFNSLGVFILNEDNTTSAITLSRDYSKKTLYGIILPIDSEDSEDSENFSLSTLTDNPPTSKGRKWGIGWTANNCKSNGGDWCRGYCYDPCPGDWSKWTYNTNRINSPFKQDYVDNRNDNCECRQVTNMGACCSGNQYGNVSQEICERAKGQFIPNQTVSETYAINQPRCCFPPGGCTDTQTINTVNCEKCCPENFHVCTNKESKYHGQCIRCKESEEFDEATCKCECEIDCEIRNGEETHMVRHYAINQTNNKLERQCDACICKDLKKRPECGSKSTFKFSADAKKTTKQLLYSKGRCDCVCSEELACNNNKEWAPNSGAIKMDTGFIPPICPCKCPSDKTECIKKNGQKKCLGESPGPTYVLRDCEWVCGLFANGFSCLAVNEETCEYYCDESNHFCEPCSSDETRIPASSNPRVPTLADEKSCECVCTDPTNYECECRRFNRNLKPCPPGTVRSTSGGCGCICDPETKEKCPSWDSSNFKLIDGNMVQMNCYDKCTPPSVKTPDCKDCQCPPTPWIPGTPSVIPNFCRKQNGEYVCVVCDLDKGYILDEDCNCIKPTSTPTASSEPTPTASSEPTPTASSEPTPTASSEPTPTASSEPTPTASSEPTPTPFPTPSSTTECLGSCSVNLQCVSFEDKLVWSSISFNSFNCEDSCSSKIPNIPTAGYWGCCDTLNLTTTFEYPCPECSTGLSPSVNNCEECENIIFNNNSIEGVWNGQDCIYTVTCYQCNECPTGRTRQLKKEQIENKKCSDFTNQNTGQAYVSSCDECDEESDEESDDYSGSLNFYTIP